MLKTDIFVVILDLLEQKNQFFLFFIFCSFFLVVNDVCVDVDVEVLVDLPKIIHRGNLLYKLL